MKAMNSFASINDNKAVSKSQEHIDTTQCPQCGADINLSPKRRLGNCPFCNSRLHLSGYKLQNKWMVKPVLMRSECHRILSAWLWENYQGTASSLEIEKSLWIPYSRKNKSAREKDFQPLASFPEQVMQISMPPGEYLAFDPEKTSGFILPEDDINGDQENMTVYVPFHIAGFSYGGKRETAVIEASTGSMAGYLPDKRVKLSNKWMTLSVAGLVFLLEAILIKPVIAKTVILGLSFVILEIAITLIWEGWGWRK
jgi:hypothetical protein